MIKKLKAIIPLLCVISTSAYGYDELLKDTRKYTESGRPLIYVKANVGAALLRHTEDTASKLNMKSKSVPYFSVGVGTYLMDSSRIDLNFEHVANPVLKKSSSVGLANLVSTNIGKFYINGINDQAASVFSTSGLTQLGFNPNAIPLVQQILQGALGLFRNNTAASNFSDLIIQAAVNNATQNGTTAAIGQRNGQQIVQILGNLSNTPGTQVLYDLLTQDFANMSVSTSVNHKATANAFMVNGSLDLFELNRVKFFVGAGFGCVQLKEKITITSNLNISGKNSVIIDQSTSTKKANNFAYSLALGTSAKVTDKVTLELVYNWKDFGKTKSAKIQGIEVGKTPYRSHTLSAGVRVEI